MKILYKDKVVEGKVMDFSTRKEDFNEYMLTNGTILKIKAVVTCIVEIPGERDPDGNPIYVLKSQNIVAPVDVPK